jgi:hypothetical protein
LEFERFHRTLEEKRQIEKQRVELETKGVKKNVVDVEKLRKVRKEKGKCMQRNGRERKISY